MITVDPRGLSTRDWVDYTTSNLDRFVPVMKIRTDDQWRIFGSHVKMLLRSRGFDTPDPYQFTDWRKWADRFNQVIVNLA